MNKENNSIEYKEIAKAKISKSRNAVISSCSKGGYTIAQQVELSDGNSTMNIFLKGAIHVEDLECLKSLRELLSVAIRIAENEKNEIEWDN